MAKRKMIVIVGRTIGQARELMYTVQKALPGVPMGSGPGGNVYLVNWTSEASKFRGFDRETLRVMYADEFDAKESQLLQLLDTYETLHDVVEVHEYLNDGPKSKPGGRKFRG